jgi:hypothetical protein
MLPVLEDSGPRLHDIAGLLALTAVAVLALKDWFTRDKAPRNRPRDAPPLPKP